MYVMDISTHQKNILNYIEISPTLVLVGWHIIFFWTTTLFQLLFALNVCFRRPKPRTYHLYVTTVDGLFAPFADGVDEQIEVNKLSSVQFTLVGCLI